MDLNYLVNALFRRTPWTLRLLVFVVLATTGFLAASLRPAGATEPAPQRYLDKVFDRATVTKDVRYAPTPAGSAVDRLGDVYEPEGDTAARRPAVVWLHGSGADKAGVVENYVGTMFARHGAVAVSIDYRARAFRTDGSYDNLPVEDASAALAWLRAHADEYRVDPNRIVLAGASAGGMAALDTAYLGHDDGLAAVLSIVGTGPEDGARGDGPPTLMINGDADQIVRLERATRFCDEVNQAGGSCTLQSFPSGHPIYGFATEIEQVVSDWFWRTLDFGSLTGTPGPVSYTHLTLPTNREV